jgi:alkylated DNA repair dioxygenase AlkB
LATRPGCHNAEVEHAPLQIDRSAPTERTELSEGSWVDVSTGFVTDAAAQFAEMFAQTDWLQAEVLRYHTYVPERRLMASLPVGHSPLLRQTQLHLEAAYRVKPTGVGAILYRDGNDFQGLHSDREMRWLDNTLIAIVVLGVRRPFVFRQRAGDASFVDRTPAGKADGDVVLMPGEGDLLVMRGAHQRDWLHGVPAADTDRARISLTWRWTSRQGRPDTNPGYYEGRQFSDRPRQPGSRMRRPTT